MSQCVTSSELLMLQEEGTGGETEWLPTPSAHLMVHKISLLFG